MYIYAHLGHHLVSPCLTQQFQPYTYMYSPLLLFFLDTHHVCFYSLTSSKDISVCFCEMYQLNIIIGRASSSLLLLCTKNVPSLMLLVTTLATISTIHMWLPYEDTKRENKYIPCSSSRAGKLISGAKKKLLYTRRSVEA